MYARANPLGDSECTVQVCVWQYDGELLAPVARGEISGSIHGTIYGFADAPQAVIAGEVAVVIVE